MTSKSRIQGRQRDGATHRSASAAQRRNPAVIALAALLVLLLAPSVATAQVTKRDSKTAFNGNSGASSLTVPAPAAVAGDLLLAQVTFDKGSDATVAPQGMGWSLVGRTNNSSNVGQAVYWKQAALGEPMGYAWNFTKNGPFTARASGASPPTPAWTSQVGRSWPSTVRAATRTR